MSNRGRPAVFLDRDGVINALVPDARTGTLESPCDPAGVRLLPGVADAIEKLSDAGYVIVVVSNQPAAAKGVCSPADLEAVHGRVVELLGPTASSVADWRYCHHHPEALDPRLRQCDCRKPKPGLLIEAAEEHGIDLAASWIVGDADRDIAAGQAAGTRTVLIENPGSAHRRTGDASADATVADLPAAASAIAPRPR